jgi:hypothetical protein
MRARIFGIGLSKTGTHSLTRALDVLGRSCVHFPDPGLMLDGRYEEALGDHDAATDVSVAAFYPQLDRAFPGSRFVLTLRDVEAWLDSVEDHRRRRAHETDPACPKAAVRQLLYATRGFDRGVFRRAYHEHERSVRAYFADRPDDLLILDLCAEPSWDALCAFLGEPIPGAPFPHLNAREPVSTSS